MRPSNSTPIFSKLTRLWLTFLKPQSRHLNRISPNRAKKWIRRKGAVLRRFLKLICTKQRTKTNFTSFWTLSFAASRCGIKTTLLRYQRKPGWSTKPSTGGTGKSGNHSMMVRSRIFPCNTTTLWRSIINTSLVAKFLLLKMSPDQPRTELWTLNLVE